jgi:hypothetical protein
MSNSQKNFLKVEKRAITLRKALSNKLKTRNLDIEKCSAFLMYSKYVIKLYIFGTIFWRHLSLDNIRRAT